MEPPPVGHAPADNPYAAPVNSGMVAERRAFPDIPTPDLKKLRNDSHTIRAVVALIILGLVLLGIVMLTAVFVGNGMGAAELIVVTVIGGLQSVVMIGLIQRATWGRIAGFISGSFMLFGFPIGTLIGILFLVSLIRGARLFGPDRLAHKELEAEWKYRKKNKVV